MKQFKKIASVHLLLITCWVVPASALAQAAEEQQAFKQILGAIRWSGVVTSVFVVFGAWLGLRFLENFVDRLSVQFPARRMTFQKVGTIIQFFAYFVTITLVIALSVRLDENLLPVLGGTFALAVGFGVRDLVASIIAGITIMLDQPFQVGDRVAFGGEYGDITAIGLRSVRLQTLDDNTVTIPNNKFLTDVTSCGNYGALDMQVVMDFYIGLDQPVDLAREVVNEAALTSRYVHLPKPVVVLVSQVIQQNYVAIRLRLKAYVLDTQYERDFETDVNLRVMRAFEKRGIQPPAILVRNQNGDESLARPVSAGVV
jgi:small-conductance mechanosensitive channel